MQKTQVSLLVMTSAMSLDEVSAKLGHQPSSGSHSVGDAHAGARLGTTPWEQTIWRFDSGASETAIVEEHLERLQMRFPAVELNRVLPPDCEVLIDVAIYFDTANVSISMLRHALEIVANYQARLEVTCYPSTFSGQS